MLRWIIPFAYCGAVVAGSIVLGVSVWLAYLVAIVLPWLGFCKVYVPRTAPRKLLRAATREVDPTAGPPPGAEPVELAVAERMTAARDWDAYRALYTDDATFPRNDKNPLSLDRYFVRARAVQKLLGLELIGFLEMRADPGRPHTFWVSGVERANPRHHPPFELEWWETWTLTPDRERIRVRHHIAFTYAGDVRAQVLASSPSRA